jgi:hypothetical protein
MTTGPDLVVVFVPGEATMVITPDGREHPTQVDENGRRYVEIKTDFARVMLNSGLPCSLAWKEANAALAERLGPMPKFAPGIAIGRLQHAALEASRPRMILEDLAEMRAELHGWRR